jgi:integrase
MPRRRDSGEGTLYYSKANKYWEGQLPPALRNTPGVKNFVRDKDKATARQMLNDRIKEAKAVRTSRVRTPENYTIEACVREWLDHPDESKIGPRTLVKYVGQTDTWIIPRIGSLTLSEVTPAILTKFFEDIAPGLGARSLADLHGILRRSVRRAQKQLIIDRNDVELVDLPKAGQEPREHGAMTREDIEKLMAYARKTRHHALIAVSVYMGLRPGELMKLRWDHVDLEAGVLYVWRSTSDGDKTKNRQSKRTLKIPKRALEALKSWKTEQAAERAKAGPVWNEHGLVFCYEDGRPYTIHNLRTRYYTVTKTAGVGKLSPYKGRHTFASVLFDSGMEITRIAPLMGHANSTVTETVYTHLIKPVLNDAADAIDDAFE